MPNKLTSKQVEEMIELRSRGVRIKDLAERYGVSYAYISQLTQGAYQEVKVKVWDKQTRETWRELHALVCQIKRLAGR